MARINLEEMMWKARIKSLSELSSKSGVSRPALQNWRDNNVSRLELPLLEKVCHVLDCDIKDIIVFDEQERDKVKGG